mmetsp:Transcript_62736/g.176935  ORF Transcript_62736/g.176935 Transcript_62736/m.176935 type:complete len:362 (+) Transcript_62736:107-1192(+)
MSLASFDLLRHAQVGLDTYVFKLDCNCDVTAVAAATSEHSICLLDPASLAQVQCLGGHDDIVEDVAFFQASPACLVSCSHDGSARVWDLRAAGACAQRFEVASNEVYSCTVGCGDAALACAASEKVHLFDLVAGKRRRVYSDYHTDVVNRVRFHPAEPTKLLSGAEDGLVVVADTRESSTSEAMLAVVPNEECVRGFTLVGPGRDTLCCVSTTEDVRIWGLGPDDCGSKQAEFVGLREHALLSRDDSGGYVVETFYDQPSNQVFLLAGAGGGGDMLLFQLAPGGAAPVAQLSAGDGAAGHTGIVRSALCLPGGIIVTAGEDGRVCAWRETSSADQAEQFGLEPTAYGAQRSGAGSGRAAPY